MNFKAMLRFLNNMCCLSTAFLLFLSCPVSAQGDGNNLTIIIREDGGDSPPAAWIQIDSESEKNINGWYSGKRRTGFPAYSPVSLSVPPGEITITAWNRECEPVEKKIRIREGRQKTVILNMHQVVDIHKLGYYSFDSHNHLNGYEEKNRPPYLYPYCATLGIDHLDICQGWLFGLRMPVSYDSIIHYLDSISTDHLDIRFGSETPKLRYGHTWTIHHPGLKEPFNDYLKWHDTAYFSAIQQTSDSFDLRTSLHPSWHPPFVDRSRYRKEGGFTVAAHPTRWWHTGVNEQYPATNISADLAFDLLTIQSYDGIVVMGDEKDHIFYQNLWFHLLNLGYRLVPLAESDGNVDRGSLGYKALCYVSTGEAEYNYSSFLRHIKPGHVMLSGKALMFLLIDDGLPQVRNLRLMVRNITSG